MAARKVVFPETVIQALESLEAQMGGRAQLVGMLTLAPLTADLRYVLGLLGDPQNVGKSLAAICAQGNILPAELLKHLSGAALLRGKVLASQQIGAGIAAVAADIMRRAAPFQETCYGCAGTGTFTAEPTKEVPNPIPAPCEVCRGGGVLAYMPELDRQKLAIEMAQLLPKSGGLQILNANVQASSGGASGGLSPFERLQAATDRLLYGGGPQAQLEEAEGTPDIEGEVVPPERPEPAAPLDPPASS